MIRAVRWFYDFWDVFLRHVWRHNDYLSPHGRITVRYAATIAATIADTLHRYR